MTNKYYNFYANEKMAVFIDGANLYAAAKTLELDIDYKKLLKWMSHRSKLVRAYYYTALIDDQEYSPVKPLADWLDYNGYTMITKPVKEYTDASGRKKIKSNMSIDLAVDAMEIAENVDHIVLFSGDGDFKRLIQALQRKSVRVTVISTTETQPSMIADELRRQADAFMELTELEDIMQDYDEDDEGLMSALA